MALVPKKLRHLEIICNKHNMEEKDYKATAITMVKDAIEMAINRGYDITVTYSKDSITTSIIHITDVSYSAKYGKNYITGFSGEKELTLKIDRIVNVEVEWITISERNICSEYEGLYLIAFNGPWFLEYELKICKKGDKILDGRQENENGIGLYDYSPESSLAYHYVPLLNNEMFGKWIRYSKVDDVPLLEGVYVIAYKLDKPEIKNREIKWIRSTWRCSDDIYYSDFIYNGDTSFAFSNVLPNPHIEILAYYYCPKYNEHRN